MITSLFIIIALVVIVAYDLFAELYWGDYATISVHLRNIADRWGMFPYLIAFAVGVLFGHLFLCGVQP